MTSYTAAMLEDEPLARERLRQLLSEHPDVELVAELGSVREAADVLPRVRPDLLFLDIELPPDCGFDVLTAPDAAPVVIVTTAHPNFALEAFSLNVADYLVKPFHEERFAKALDRARRLLSRGTRAGKPPKARRERFAVRVDGEIVFLKAEDIHWIGAKGNHVRIHTSHGAYLVRDTLQHLEETLDPTLFARVHRSVIVNLERVKKVVLTDEESHEIVLEGGVVLPFGATYRTRFEEAVGVKL